MRTYERLTGLAGRLFPLGGAPGWRPLRQRPCDTLSEAASAGSRCRWRRRGDEQERARVRVRACLRSLFERFLETGSRGLLEGEHGGLAHARW